MCGIWGLVAKNPNGFYKDHIDLAQNMLLCGQLRGTHGTGMFLVDKEGNPEYLKIGGNAQQLMDTKEFNPFMSRVLQKGTILVGHNRFATKGDHSTPNAHPFQYKQITLVHNGTVTSTDLEKNKVKVDSHSFTKDIANADDFKEHLQLTRGAFCFVWYNKKLNKLLIYRNDERPLSMFEADNSFIFASEGNMVRWLAGRKNIKHDYREIKPEVLYSFDMSVNGPKKIEEEPLPKKFHYYSGYTPPATPPWRDTSHKNGYWRNGMFHEYNPPPLSLVPKLPAPAKPTGGITHGKKVGDNILFSLYDEAERGVGSSKVWEYQGILEEDGSTANVEVVFVTKNRDATWLDKPLLCGTICSVYPDGTLQVKTKSVEEVETTEVETIIKTSVEKEEESDTTIFTLKDGTQLEKFRFKKLTALRCLSCHDQITCEEHKGCSYSDKIGGLYCPDCTDQIEHDLSMYPMYH